jgi:hypothetical protein
MPPYNTPKSKCSWAMPPTTPCNTLSENLYFFEIDDRKFGHFSHKNLINTALLNL